MFYGDKRGFKAMRIFSQGLTLTSDIFFYNCCQKMECRLNQQIGYESNFRSSKKLLNHPDPAIQGEL